ncbi:MAG: hypothetical protein JWR84_534 [Caulobacter sp.]|nr:hypothetical protein [Caulobacter sp.]
MPRVAASVLVSVSALALLAACGPKERASQDSLQVEQQAPYPRTVGRPRPSRDAVAAIEAPQALAMAPPAPGERRGVPADTYLSKPVPGVGAMPVIAPSLAYEYGYVLELPADKARGQLTAHQRACEDAGPAVCQVIAAESYAVGAREARGLLEMRATADWLRQFRARLESDAGAAGGKVLSVTTRTEDLTRNMVDTEAAIRSQLILQARMERILAERTGDLEQAVSLEQEIARVRAGVDAMRSSLEVMRGRTAMQKLTIEYSVSGAKPPPTMKPDSPPVTALKQVGDNLLILLALGITLGSYLSPFALVGGLVWWGMKRRRARIAAQRKGGEDGQGRSTDLPPA